MFTRFSSLFFFVLLQTFITELQYAVRRAYGKGAAAACAPPFMCTLRGCEVEHRHDFYTMANPIYNETFVSYMEPNLRSDGGAPHAWSQERREAGHAAVLESAAAAKTECASS